MSQNRAAVQTEDLGLKIQTKTDALIKTAQSSQDNRTVVVTITKTATLQAVTVGACGVGADTQFRFRSNGGFVGIGASDGCARSSTAGRTLRARPDYQRGKVMNLRKSASKSAPR